MAAFDRWGDPDPSSAPRPRTGAMPARLTYQPAQPASRPSTPPPIRRRSFWRRSVAKHPDRSFLRHALIIVVLTISAIVLLRTFLLQLDSVPDGGAMQGTLQAGDRVLINKMVYNFREPYRGEVVLFHGTSTWTPDAPDATGSDFLSTLARSFGSVVGVSRAGANDHVRRVIGLPGDTVACCDAGGRVIINGVGVDEPYVTMNAPVDSPTGTPACSTRRFAPTVVQPGYVFVLGDDRLISQDSRCAGQVPIDDIVGRALAVAWPTERWTWLSVPSSLSGVPAGYSAAVVVSRPILTGLPTSARMGRHMPI